MSKPLNLNVRVSGHLSDFVNMQIGSQGRYDNLSEYVRDLIRKDQERTEREAFSRKKAELQLAFAEPDENYVTLTAQDVFARNS